MELCPYPTLSACQLLGGKSDLAANTFCCKREVNRAAYLVRNEIADKDGAVARSFGRRNQRTTRLSPLNHNAFRQSPVGSARPSDGHPTLGCRQRAVFRCVCHKFVEHHRYRFGGGSGEHDLVTINGRVAGVRVRGELVANQIGKTDTFPPTVT